MTNLLIKLFIKDKENISDPSVRQAYGALGGSVGVFCNILLFLTKSISGIITGSISIIADGFNNLSDAASSIVTLIGFKIAGKPADTDHPFGHGRAEYLSGVVVAILIMLVGVELFKSAIDKIRNPQMVKYSILSIAIMISSILLKFWMMRFNRAIGKKIQSAVMEATAVDSLSDCIATSVVILGIIVHNIFHIQIDGYIGAVVAAFVFTAGIKTISDTIQPLLGKAPDESLVNEIKQIVLGCEGILGMHDLIVHDYGPNRIMITLHAEISQAMNIIDAHTLIDGIEVELKKRFHCEVSIHMDPVATDDKLTNQMRTIVEDIVKTIEPEMSIHDFRINREDDITSLAFDVLVPFQCDLTNEQIQSEIVGALKQIDCDYIVAINFDKGYV